MAADYTALEARVAELEHQMRNILPAKVDAISFGVSVMHGEMTEQFGQMGERLGRIELQLGEHGDRLDSIDRRLDSHEHRFDAIDRRLDSHGEMLTEILRRLPGGATNAPSGGGNDQ